MLDAKTYKADYVSPNVEKLLGITVEQIQKIFVFWENCIPKEPEDPEEELSGGNPGSITEQEWDFEYVHQKTGEQRWFHIVQWAVR